jgi:hypothetical protein
MATAAAGPNNSSIPLGTAAVCLCDMDSRLCCVCLWCLHVVLPVVASPGCVFGSGRSGAFFRGACCTLVCPCEGLSLRINSMCEWCACMCPTVVASPGCVSSSGRSGAFFRGACCTLVCPCEGLSLRTISMCEWCACMCLACGCLPWLCVRLRAQRCLFSRGPLHTCVSVRGLVLLHHQRV